LRPLHAERLQTDCPRALLTMRTTRYFIKQSVTIRAIPCVHARSQPCVSGNSCHFWNCPASTSCCLPAVILKPLRPSQSAFRRTPKLAPAWNSTKRRLNLHTRHAPPAASF
jgi:hypothetical protein